MTDKTIRSGSLQFWPRKRTRKVLHKVNWKYLEKVVGKAGLLGFVGYKVGMVSVYAQDNTEDSMTKNKQIIIPATIIECPLIKIFSVRFYNNGQVAGEILVSNDKVLKRRVKISKQLKNVEDFKNEFDDVRVIVYSDAKSAGLKKKPDMIELALGGSKDEKLKFVKEKIGKGISVIDVFKNELVDVRGLTKGKGFSGPVKRFGITLKAKKSEKGQRRPGSLAPWHPARVTFRTPMAGQLGYFSRITYNNSILQVGKISDKNINQKGGFHKYGDIKTEFVILRGSIPGPKKRALLITPAIRPTRKKSKLNFEVLELR